MVVFHLNHHFILHCQSGRLPDSRENGIPHRFSRWSGKANQDRIWGGQRWINNDLLQGKKLTTYSQRLSHIEGRGMWNKKRIKKLKNFLKRKKRCGQLFSVVFFFFNKTYNDTLPLQGIYAPSTVSIKQFLCFLYPQFSTLRSTDQYLLPLY